MKKKYICLGPQPRWSCTVLQRSCVRLFNTEPYLFCRPRTNLKSWVWLTIHTWVKMQVANQFWPELLLFYESATIFVRECQRLFLVYFYLFSLPCPLRGSMISSCNSILPVSNHSRTKNKKCMSAKNNTKISGSKHFSWFCTQTDMWFVLCYQSLSSKRQWLSWSLLDKIK